MVLEGALTVTVGERVAFVFTVRNTGADAVVLEFQTGQPADVTVSQDGAAVWRWSDGRMFTQARWRETLEPGEEFIETMRWDTPDAGAYTAEATLAASNVSVTASTPFDVQG